MSKRKKRKNKFDETLLDRVVFATWNDVAPSLIYIGETPEHTAVYIEGLLRGNGFGNHGMAHDDMPITTLRDVLQHPRSHGVGGPIGGWET